MIMTVQKSNRLITIVWQASVIMVHILRSRAHTRAGVDTNTNTDTQPLPHIQPHSHLTRSHHILSLLSRRCHFLLANSPVHSIHLRLINECLQEQKIFALLFQLTLFSHLQSILSSQLDVLSKV